MTTFDEDLRKRKCQHSEYDIRSPHRRATNTDEFPQRMHIAPMLLSGAKPSNELSSHEPNRVVSNAECIIIPATPEPFSAMHSVKRHSNGFRSSFKTALEGPTPHRVKKMRNPKIMCNVIEIIDDDDDEQPCESDVQAESTSDEFIEEDPAESLPNRINGMNTCASLATIVQKSLTKADAMVERLKNAHRRVLEQTFSRDYRQISSLLPLSNQSTPRTALDTMRNRYAKLEGGRVPLDSKWLHQAGQTSDNISLKHRSAIAASQQSLLKSMSNSRLHLVKIWRTEFESKSQQAKELQTECIYQMQSKERVLSQLREVTAERDELKMTALNISNFL